MLKTGPRRSLPKSSKTQLPTTKLKPTLLKSPFTKPIRTFAATPDNNNKQQGKSGKVDPRLEKQRKREEEKRAQQEAAKQLASAAAKPTATTTTTTSSTPQQQDNDNNGDTDDKKKPQRTWLLIHSEMQLKTISGSLENTEKASNNADRKKLRQEQVRDLLTSQELIEKLVPQMKNHSTKVWCRKLHERDQPQLITFGEALKLAKLDGEFSTVALLRSSTQNPPMPANIRNVPDDKIIPVWIMEPKKFLDELYEKDTIQVKGHGFKEISINSTITPDDLHRKIQSAIDFLFDGNTVRLMCNSKSVKKLQSWVESNTHFSKEEVAQQAQSAIESGKLFDANGEKLFARDSAEQRLKGQNIQKDDETDTAYQTRINQMVDKEKVLHDQRQEQRKQELKLAETRIQQSIEQLSNDIKKFTGILVNLKTVAAQALREAQQDSRHPQHRATKGLKPGQFLPEHDQQSQALIKHIGSMDHELSQWRERLSGVKRGNTLQLRVSPHKRYVNSEGMPIPVNDNDSDDVTRAKAKLAARGGGGGLGDDSEDDDDDDDGEKGGGMFNRYDEGGDAGGGDVDLSPLGDATNPDDLTDEQKKTRSMGKLTKKELEEKKTKLQLDKMTAKERVLYLASVMAKQKYHVIGDIVDTLGKVSTIMVMERAERKKNKTPLAHEEMDPAAYAKLSNKDKKRYDQRMAAIRADPNAQLKLEIQNAMELFHKGKYIYNDTILEQQTKKPFWCSHDGGATPQEAAGKNSLTLNILKSALGDNKKM